MFISVKFPNTKKETVDNAVAPCIMQVTSASFVSVIKATCDKFDMYRKDPPNVDNTKLVENRLVSLNGSWNETKE